MNKNATRPRRRISVIGASLLVLGAVACGSDDGDSDSTSAATEASSAVSSQDSDLDSSADSSSDSTVETTGSPDETTDATAATGTSDAGSETTDTVPAATADDDREAIVEYLRNLAGPAGIEIDEDCIAALVSQLSDEDAALLGDSARAGGAGGEPQLSAAGEAIGDQLATCAIVATATTTG